MNVIWNNNGQIHGILKKTASNLSLWVMRWTRKIDTLNSIYDILRKVLGISFVLNVHCTRASCCVCNQSFESPVIFQIISSYVYHTGILYCRELVWLHFIWMASYDMNGFQNLLNTCLIYFEKQTNTLTYITHYWQNGFNLFVLVLVYCGQ